jgi:hypothetical protein
VGQAKKGSMNNDGRFHRRWIALMVQMPGSEIPKLAVKPRVLGIRGRSDRRREPAAVSSVFCMEACHVQPCRTKLHCARCHVIRSRATSNRTAASDGK